MDIEGLHGITASPADTLRTQLQQRLNVILSDAPTDSSAAEARKIIIVIELLNDGDTRGAVNLMKVLPYSFIDDNGELRLDPEQSPPDELDGLGRKGKLKRLSPFTRVKSAINAKRAKRASELKTDDVTMFLRKMPVESRKKLFAQVGMSGYDENDLEGLSGKFINFFKNAASKVKNIVQKAKGNQPAPTSTAPKKNRPVINKIKTAVQSKVQSGSFVEKAKNFFDQVKPTIQVDATSRIEKNWMKYLAAFGGMTAITVIGYKAATSKKK